MSLWAFLSTLSAARGLFTWPGPEVLPTEHTHNLITHTLFLSESTFSIVSLLAGNTVVTNTVLYVYSMCMLWCTRSSPPPIITTRSQMHPSTLRTVLSSVPLALGTKSTASCHTHYCSLCPRTHTFTHTLPSALLWQFSAVWMWCCWCQKQLCFTRGKTQHKLAY